MQLPELGLDVPARRGGALRIGTRLDDRPELLFHLRQVDEEDLIAKAGSGLPLSTTGAAAGRVLAADGLSKNFFGLEMTTVDDDPAPPAPAKPAKGHSAKAKRAAKKTPTKRQVARSASQPGPFAKPGIKTKKKSSRPPQQARVREATSKTRAGT